MIKNKQDIFDGHGKTTVNVLLADAGMGDHICGLVAIDYILKYQPHLLPLIWVPDYLLDLAKNVLPDDAIVRNYTEAIKKYDNDRTGISTTCTGRHSPMRTHPVDYAFHMLCDSHVDYKDKNYLKVKFDRVDITEFNLPEKYVVIQATAAEKVKTMPVNTTNAIIDYVIGKGYTPVFVGKNEMSVGVVNQKMKSTTLDINLDKGINIINKTSMLQTAKIIEESKAFIGMDGGTTHIAGCTNAPIVVGYTFIDPSHNLPIRNNELGWNCYTVVPDESLNCRFCQTWGTLLYDWDFRECHQEKENKFECVKHITADKFIKHLDNIL